VLAALVRRLDDAGIVPVELALLRPSLDEVFLSLTSHPGGSGDTATPTDSDRSVA
jgi:hypothetical protein